MTMNLFDGFNPALVMDDRRWPGADPMQRDDTVTKRDPLGDHAGPRHAGHIDIPLENKSTMSHSVHSRTPQRLHMK